MTNFEISTAVENFILIDEKGGDYFSVGDPWRSLF